MKRLGICVLAFAFMAPLWLGAQQPMEISWMLRVKSGEQTTWAIQEIEKKFNVKIKPNGIDPNDGPDKVNVMLAAGEFPDAGLVFLHDAYQLFDDGIIRGIPDKLVRANAPNYSKLLDQNFPYAWLMNRNKQKTDEALAVLSFSANTEAGLWYLGFRYDWMKKVGIDLPGYDSKKVSLDRAKKVYFYDYSYTLDWFEKLLVAFRDKDPDGNGKNDTIPFAANKYNYWTWPAIWGAFGFGHQNFNLMENGKLVMWNVSNAYKDFLKLAARWYKMGLVDKEFPTLDLTPAWQKVAEQRIGATTAFVPYADQPGTLSRPPNTLVPDDQVAKGAQAVILPPPVGPAGRGTVSYSLLGVGNPFFVNKNVDDAKLAKILQILDWGRYNGDEGFMTMLYGMPNVHFTWSGLPWQSPVIARTYDQTPAGYPKEGDWGNVYPAGYTREKLKYVYTDKIYQFYNNWFLAPAGQALTLRPLRADVFNETDFTAVFNKNNATLETIRSEFELKAITGEIDIDTEWAKYDANWRSNGGDDLIANLAKSPLVSELRKGKRVY